MTAATSKKIEVPQTHDSSSFQSRRLKGFCHNDRRISRLPTPTGIVCDSRDSADQLLRWPIDSRGVLCDQVACFDSCLACGCISLFRRWLKVKETSRRIIRACQEAASTNPQLEGRRARISLIASVRSRMILMIWIKWPVPIDRQARNG